MVRTVFTAVLTLCHLAACEYCLKNLYFFLVEKKKPVRIMKKFYFFTFREYRCFSKTLFSTSLLDSFLFRFRKLQVNVYGEAIIYAKKKEQRRKETSTLSMTNAQCIYVDHRHVLVSFALLACSLIRNACFFCLCALFGSSFSVSSSLPLFFPFSFASLLFFHFPLRCEHKTELWLLLFYLFSFYYFLFTLGSSSSLTCLLLGSLSVPLHSHNRTRNHACVHVSAVALNTAPTTKKQ